MASPRAAPRSGLAVKHGIDVGAGVIDSDYRCGCYCYCCCQGAWGANNSAQRGRRGPVGVVLFNHGATPFIAEKGMRIAQLILQRVLVCGVQEVSELDDTERGDGGFGSTGTT